MIIDHTQNSKSSLIHTQKILKNLLSGGHRKQMDVPLPHNIWHPHIVLWCQALDHGSDGAGSSSVTNSRLVKVGLYWGL
jgi:hypothetical protein